MRLLSVLTTATALSGLLSSSMAAQEGRQFKDAWFWGVKGGGVTYASQSTTGSAAPLAGAEWLITRTNGGLYLGFDQAFFTTTGGFLDRDPDSTFVRPVTLRNLRRFSLAAMAFPGTHRRIHPYGGLGLVLNQVASAALLTGAVSTTRYAIALDSVQSKKAAFSPLLIAGVQARLRPFSVFAQTTAAPTQQRFFLTSPNRPRSFSFSVEAGVRYNVGSSIDRAR